MIIYLKYYIMRYTYIKMGNIMQNNNEQINLENNALTESQNELEINALQEDNNELQINDNTVYGIPTIAVRGKVIFPNVFTTIDVGRIMTLNAIQKALKGDKKVVA